MTSQKSVVLYGLAFAQASGKVRCSLVFNGQHFLFKEVTRADLWRDTMKFVVVKTIDRMLERVVMLNHNKTTPDTDRQGPAALCTGISILLVIKAAPFRGMYMRSLSVSPVLILMRSGRVAELNIRIRVAVGSGCEDFGFLIICLQKAINDAMIWQSFSHLFICVALQQCAGINILRSVVGCNYKWFRYNFFHFTQLLSLASSPHLNCPWFTLKVFKDKKKFLTQFLDHFEQI